MSYQPVNWGAMTKHQQYEYLLKHHDWLYQFSDDHSMYLKGQAEHSTIMEMASTIDPDLHVYKQYQINPFDEV